MEKGTLQVGLVTPDAASLVDAASALAWWRPAGGLEPARGPLAWYDLAGPWLQALRRLDGALRTDDELLARMRQQGFVVAIASCRLGGPVARPGKIVCVGLNYRDHAAEAKMDVPQTPVIFAKFSSAVIGSGTSIVLPTTSHRVDYEAELAVVIGRQAKRTDAANALDSVLGYMNANDVSARDFQKLDGQWVRAKSCDTFAPMGPWLVTADEVPNPNALAIELRLNGAVMQQSSTDEFVFDVGHIIRFLTESMTLEPGDVILTGTPPGVGFARRPPVFLKPGDIVEVEIEKLGVLRNPVVAG
jgi:2-keto-4-pentenoate hydratase/2-oxohepta-3-ene-1,7-dioic acid hydratase in catechol pathway